MTKPMTDERLEIHRRIIEAATFDTDQAAHAVNQSIAKYEEEIRRLREANERLQAEYRDMAALHLADEQSLRNLEKRYTKAIQHLGSAWGEEDFRVRAFLDGEEEMRMSHEGFKNV